jgi:hypothetical protein
MVDNQGNPATSVHGGKTGQSCYISTWWVTWAVLLHQYMVDNQDNPATSLHGGEAGQSWYIIGCCITWSPATSVHGGKPGQSCYIIAQGSTILKLHVLKHYGLFSIKSEFSTK